VVVANSVSKRELETSSRFGIYGAAIALAILFLLFQRFLSSIPFYAPANYRSFAIVNQSDFVELYGPEVLPKSPIEELKGESLYNPASIHALVEPNADLCLGARLKLAWAQAVCFGGLVLVSATLLVLRILGGAEYIEEGGLWKHSVTWLCRCFAYWCHLIAAELAYWTFFFVLFAFRFYPTPYRPTLFALASLATLVPLVLIFERDLLQKFLLHPSPRRLHQVRTGWGTYARIALSLSVLSLSMSTPRVWYPVDPYSDDDVSPEQVRGPRDFEALFVVLMWEDRLRRFSVTS
jgi:hypothetical protein